MGWELRWGGEGEEKVKGRARMREREFKGEDSVHEAMHGHCAHTPPPHSLRGGEGRGGEGRGEEGRGVCMKPWTHCTHACTHHAHHTPSLHLPTH